MDEHVEGKDIRLEDSAEGTGGSDIKINPNLTTVTDMSGLQVKNIMEEVVWQKIESILSHVDNCCRCTKCKNDIMAITLNNVPSKYVASKQGEMYSKITACDLQNDTRLSAIITSAILYVKDHPRH
ncbi:MAG: late competence development ComFB family protein [Acetanaerobacterium sp.]